MLASSRRRRGGGASERNQHHHQACNRQRWRGTPVALLGGEGAAEAVEEGEVGQRRLTPAQNPNPTKSAVITHYRGL